MRYKGGDLVKSNKTIHFRVSEDYTNKLDELAFRDNKKGNRTELFKNLIDKEYNIYKGDK